MTKRSKIIIAVFILFNITIGYYIYSTLNNEIIVNEASPVTTEVNMEILKEEMTNSEQKQFLKELDELQKNEKEMNEDSAQLATILKKSPFKPFVHSVSGNALLIQGENKKYIRFENFETDNGPNLHIYLATDTSSTDYIDLGEIKATKGNVNYEVDNDVDLEKYNHVLVWCVPFSVLFSYAEL